MDEPLLCYGVSVQKIMRTIAKVLSPSSSNMLLGDGGRRGDRARSLKRPAGHAQRPGIPWYKIDGLVKYSLITIGEETRCRRLGSARIIEGTLYQRCLRGCSLCSWWYPFLFAFCLQPQPLEDREVASSTRRKRPLRTSRKSRTRCLLEVGLLHKCWCYSPSTVGGRQAFHCGRRWVRL